MRIFDGRTTIHKQHYNIYIIETLLVLGVILGSLYANICCTKNVGIQGVFDFNFIEKMQQMNISQKELFNYIIVQRIKLWLVLLVLTLSFIKGMVMYGYSIFTGFMAGIIGSGIVMSHGLKGVYIFAMVNVISQAILFGANVVLIILVINIQNSQSIYGNQNGKIKANKVITGMLWIILSLILVVLSAYLESVFNILVINNFY